MRKREVDEKEREKREREFFSLFLFFRRLLTAVKEEK